MQLTAQISQTVETDPLGCVAHIHEYTTVGILTLLMCCCVHLKVNEMQFSFNYSFHSIMPFLTIAMYKSDFSFISFIVTE